MSLDLKKKRLELARVQLAKQELEMRIEERLEEITRMKDHIKIQEEAEKKINNELTALSNKE